MGFFIQALFHSGGDAPPLRFAGGLLARAIRWRLPSDGDRRGVYVIYQRESESDQGLGYKRAPKAQKSDLGLSAE